MEQGAGELASRIIMLVMRFVAAAALFRAGGLSVSAAGELAIIKGADEFEFVYRVKLPEITGAARVWIPLAKTDSFQNVTVEELNIPTKWDKVQDRNYGNDICVLNAQPSDSGKTIEVRYRVVRKEKAAYSAGNADNSRYLRPEKLVPVDISEARKNPMLADYYFGHNPANRFALSKGRDLLVDPEPESGPINFLVYPRLEMNGQDIKPETTFSFRRTGA